MARCP